MTQFCRRVASLPSRRRRKSAYTRVYTFSCRRRAADIRIYTFELCVFKFMLIISPASRLRRRRKFLAAIFLSLSHTQLPGAEIKNICMKNSQRDALTSSRLEHHLVSARRVLFNEKQARRAKRGKYKFGVKNWEKCCWLLAGSVLIVLRGRELCQLPIFLTGESAPKCFLENRHATLTSRSAASTNKTFAYFIRSERTFNWKSNSLRH